MRRREFITLVGGAVVAVPVAMRAQQPARIPRLGIVLYSTPQDDPETGALQQGLRDLGYIHVRIWRSSIALWKATQNGFLVWPQISVRLKPDMLFPIGGDVIPFVGKATQTFRSFL
jgi:putative ABC transport system substrate-binding protein